MRCLHCPPRFRLATENVRCWSGRPHYRSFRPAPQTWKCSVTANWRSLPKQRGKQSRPKRGGSRVSFSHDFIESKTQAEVNDIRLGFYRAKWLPHRQLESQTSATATGCDKDFS